MAYLSDMGRGFVALALAAAPLTLSGHAARVHHAAAHQPDALGLTLGEGRGTGTVVTSLRSGGPAERGGVHVGDQIHAINGLRTSGATAVRRALRRPDVCHVALDLRRRGQPIVATMDHCRHGANQGRREQHGPQNIGRGG